MKFSYELLRAVGISATFVAIFLPVVPTFAATSTEVAKQGKMDEVVVTAQEEKLTKLRADIVAAEERFYDLYNKLNDNPDYDVVCTREAATGTRISQRVCRPKFVMKAQEDEARAILTGEIVPPANMVINDKMDGYKKHALSVINKNNQLRKLIRQREETEKRYAKIRKEKMKGHWFVWD